jgi:hypothetical protein
MNYHIPPHAALNPLASLHAACPRFFIGGRGDGEIFEFIIEMMKSG